MFPNKRSLASALALALLAVAVRLPAALRESFWHDECLTRQVALLPWSDWASGFAATESSPPAYFLLAKLGASLCDGGWTGEPPAWKLSLRLPSLLASALAALILWGGARRHFGPIAGWTAGLYLTLHPWLIWHGAEARPYALWTMALGGLLIATLDVSRAPSGEAVSQAGGGRLAALWTAWAALALATHYFAVLPLMAASGFWLARIVFAPDKTPARWRPWLASHAALLPILGALAWLMKVQAASGHTAYIAPAPLKDLGRTFLVVMPFGLDAALFPMIRLAGAAGMLGLLGLAGWRLGQGWQRTLRRAPLPAKGQAQGGWRDLLMIGWLILPPLGLFAISKLLRPVYLYDRYPIMSLPALALLVGATAQWIADGWRARQEPDRGLFFPQLVWPLRILGVATVASLFLGASWQAVRYARPGEGTLRPDWEAISRNLIEAGADPAWPIYVPDPLHALPLQHNAPDIRWKIIQDREKLAVALEQGAASFLGDMELARNLESETIHPRLIVRVAQEPKLDAGILEIKPPQ
jgi:hypothetical protein